MDKETINKVLKDFEEIVENNYKKLSFQGAPYMYSFEYDEFKEMFKQALENLTNN